MEIRKTGLGRIYAFYWSQDGVIKNDKFVANLYNLQKCANLQTFFNN